MNDSDTPAVKQKTAVKAAEEKPVDKRVIIVNKSPQKLTPSIQTENGVEEISLDPGQSSGPVKESDLTTYTRGMVDRLLLRLRPVPQGA